MPENLSYVDDLTETLEEVTTGKSEAQASAEAFLARLDQDAKFRKAVMAGLKQRRQGARKSGHMMEDE